MKAMQAAAENLAVSLADVQEAAKRICGYVRQTPLLESALLNDLLGFRLLVKAECLQVTGSFKARGAFNQILQLTDAEKKRGVVAISSGNHAQAVAYAGQKLGVPATIVMPADAPKLKLANTKAYGAEVVTYDRENEDREKIGRDLAAMRDLRLVHPYNDARTMAGQGTIGLEIFDQAKAMGISPDAIIVNCSGGGMCSGISLTRDLYGRPPAVYTSEPAEFNDAQRSLAAGRIEANDRAGGSICDALMATSPGTNCLPILLHQGVKGLAATDEEVKAAMSVANEYFKLVLEPGGAVSVACAILNRETFKGKCVVAVGSGGNTDPAEYAEMVRWGTANRARLGLKL